MEGVLRELSGDDDVLGSWTGVEACEIVRNAGSRRRPPAASDRRDFVYPVLVNHTKRIIGWFPSFISDSQPYHSLLELNWLRLLDVTPGVASVKTQPRTVYFWLDGVRRKYTPDTEVLLSNGRRLIVEAKPHDVAVSPENKPVWEAIRIRLADEGVGFKIVTDAYLKARHESVLYLQMFNTLLPDPDISFRLSAMLANGTFEPLGRLISDFENPAEARMTIMSLARRRRLRIDLSKPITNDLEISLVVPGWL
jgi:hypothetical protein